MKRSNHRKRLAPPDEVLFAEKGARFLKAVTQALAQLLVELASAKKGQLPYI
jgi:hypothetical protein